jgi:hypothetical protein
MSALTIETALPALRDHFFSEDFAAFFPQYRTLPDKERCEFWQAREAALSKAHAAWKRLRADSYKSLRRASANADQWQQMKKLWRFSREARYGTALSTSFKRTRAALLLRHYQRLSSLDATEAQNAKAFMPILEAVRTDNKQFFADLQIAMTFEKHRSPVNAFLAEYSLLMIGKRPTLTFADLHKIFHWMERKDLRRQIGRIRKKYGRLAVPLKPGRAGRPLKK